LFTLLGFRKRVQQALTSRMEGLLYHEDMIYGLVPLHLGFRQFWKDFDSLEEWARDSSLHVGWWKGFLKNTRGCGIWHEIYCLSGGYEAIYNQMPSGVGLSGFAPIIVPQGKLRMARNRLVLSQKHNKSS
jgi:hypothetical protein